MTLWALRFLSPFVVFELACYTLLPFFAILTERQWAEHLTPDLALAQAWLSIILPSVHDRLAIMTVNSLLANSDGQPAVADPPDACLPICPVIGGHEASEPDLAYLIPSCSLPATRATKRTRAGPLQLYQAGQERGGGESYAEKSIELVKTS